MERKPVSNPDLAALGEFQGTIDRNSNFRQQAFEHNLARNVRVVKLLAYLARMRQDGAPMTGAVDCVAAVTQNFSSSQSMTHMGMPVGPTQAAHFLPGQIRISGRPIWEFAPNRATRDQIEFLFAEVEHLPVTFNQADTAAEAKGEGRGLCSALANACTALIRLSSAILPPAGDRVAHRPHLAHVPHPGSPEGSTFDWSSVGLPHPDSPVGRDFVWSSIGLPHPDSPVGRTFEFNTGLRRAAAERSFGIGSVSSSVQKIPRELVQAGYQLWYREAMAAFANAISRKRAKPGIPPLVGDRFEGYTEESITARSTAPSKLWNRDDSLRILEYYREDQEDRNWNWVMVSCQEALREVELNCKD